VGCYLIITFDLNTSTIITRNGFAEVSKNLARNRSENRFIKLCRNNYVELVEYQHFFCSIVYLCLNSLRNYFDGPTELFLDLYLTKFLDILAKLVFPCTQD